MLISKKDIAIGAIIAELDALILIFLARNFEEQTAAFPATRDLIFLSWLILPALAILGICVAKKIGEKMPVIWQIAKFLLVGTSNVFVDLGILGFLQMASGRAEGAYYAAFKAVSAVCAIINSYLWNKFWSFEKKDTGIIGKEAVLFFIVATIGISLNALIASYIVNKISPTFGLNSQAWGLYAGFIAALIVFVWDFLGYKLVVFKK